MLTIDSSHFSHTDSNQSKVIQSTAPLHLSSVTIYPLSPDKPVLLHETSPDTPDEETLLNLEGAVEIPLNGKKFKITVSGTITGTFSGDGTFSVSFADAAGTAHSLEITQELHLENITVALTGCRYRADVRLSATVLYHDQESELKAEGRLNDIIHYSETDNRQSMYISTLLQNAFLHFPDGQLFYDGTLRFFLWSHPDALSMLNDQIEEDNEMLFQADSVPAMSQLPLKSIHDKPITFGTRLFPQGDDRIFLEFEVFPAQLALPFLSSDTELFIHGESYDAPFILKTRGDWSAEISNNVHLGIAESDSGNPILKSFILVKGTVKGTGLKFPEFDITSPNTFTGILFPDSPVSQKLPDQNLHLFFNSAENIRFSISMPSPLHLAGGVILETQDGSPVFPAIITANTITITTPLCRIVNQERTDISECSVDGYGNCSV